MVAPSFSCIGWQIRIPLMLSRIHLFTSMQIRIRLFTLMRILLLVKSDANPRLQCERLRPSTAPF
jgi:hypothetical protein